MTRWATPPIWHRVGSGDLNPDPHTVQQVPYPLSYLSSPEGCLLILILCAQVSFLHVCLCTACMAYVQGDQKRAPKLL